MTREVILQEISRISKERGLVLDAIDKTKNIALLIELKAKELILAHQYTNLNELL